MSYNWLHDISPNSTVDKITGGAMVYDVTKYLNDHPGGPEVMLDYAGENILY